MPDDTPTPAAPDSSTNDNQDTPPTLVPVAPDAGDDAPTEEPIRDPEAYARAQKDKADRLIAKAEDRAKAAEAQLTQLQQAQADSISTEIADLRKELEQTKTDAQKAIVDAQRVKAVVAAGLDASAAEFITGNDEASIAQQVEKLAAMVPAKPGGKARTGNAAGAAPGKSLGSWFQYHPDFQAGGPFGRGGVTEPED